MDIIRPSVMFLGALLSNFLAIFAALAGCVCVVAGGTTALKASSHEGICLVILGFCIIGTAFLLMEPLKRWLPRRSLILTIAGNMRTPR